MTPEDYKYVTTLVLTTAGIQTTILIAFLGLMYQFINKRLELIEKRLDKIEGIILENRKVTQ